MFGRPGNGGGNNRTICKFFLEGRCKFGDNCKNEHPRSQQQQQQQQTNRFAPLQNAANSGFRGQSGNPGSNRDSNPFSVTEDGIRDDLTTGKERPQWPLSAYGPGIQAPRQLLEGAIEVSPEEMRVLCYLAQASGNPQQYVQHEEKLTQQMNQQIHAVLRDLPGARKYINDGQNQHPNRNDITESAPQSSSRQDAPAQTTSGFGGGGGGAASGFGAPSNLGAPRTAFGAPTAMGQNTTFGAPSSLAPGSAFGKPAALGGGVGAFGQPSNLNQSSAFGQSSTGFGNNQQTTPFGQGAKPSPFGQPSALGQTTGFGAQSRQPQQATAFGQPTAFGAASQGQSPFAQAASNQTNASPFAQAATNQANASPFAQAASNRTNASPFAQATSGQTNASPFAQAASNHTANNSPFGQPIQNQASAPSAFGRPSQPQAASQSPFASANSSQQGFGFGTAKPSAPRPTAAPASSFASGSNRQNANIITGEDGNSYYEVVAPTRENPSNRQRERIWHPKGPPENANLDAQGPDEVYTGELGTALEEIYKAVMQTGKFTEARGLMPEIPPKRDWIGWDM